VLRRAARTTMALLLQTLLISGVALAGEKATRDEAVAMVKKAVVAIRDVAVPMAHAEIMKRGTLTDGDL
jgi:hypothetical protein